MKLCLGGIRILDLYFVYTSNKSNRTPKDILPNIYTNTGVKASQLERVRSNMLNTF